MLPSMWAVGQHLIKGPLGTQTANVANDAPLQGRCSRTTGTMWAKHLDAVADQTQNGLTWGKDFEAGKVGILPGDYGFAAAFTTPAQHAEFADAPLPGVAGNSYAPSTAATTSSSRGAPNASGAWEFIKWALQTAQQSRYPSEGMTPIRSDVLTPSFATTNPYDAVALKALAKGSVEYTLAYDAVFNEPGSPGSRCSRTRCTTATSPLACPRGSPASRARWTA